MSMLSRLGKRVINKALIFFGATLFAMCALVNGYLPGVSLAAASNQAAIMADYAGVSNDDNSPPSGTIAANTKEEMELTNTGYEIVKSNNQLADGSMYSLFNVSSSDFLSDPQIIWDAGTGRFYISMFENRGSSTPIEGLTWGYSKTADPTSASDFCTYFTQFNYGSTSFPDRESLGDTSNFLLISSNRYQVSNYDLLGSDAAWITKPPAGNTCVPMNSLRRGITPLYNPDGTSAYTPTSARQIDPTPTGSIVATPSYMGGSSLTLFKVTDNNGSADISAPESVAVPAYSNPPDAPQKGTTMSGAQAPPLETRVYLTQVIMAYDPRVGHEDLWTANTVAGGAGSEVQWYEINPSGLDLDQTGIVSNPNLWFFNATITPDRVNNGTKTDFGSSAVINFSSSSSSSYPAIQMVSVVNGKQQSAMTTVKQSKGADIDFSCFEPNDNECRWGDYSGAVPDPASSLTGSHGQVWLVNQWNVPDINDSTPVWQTLIWRAQVE